MEKSQRASCNFRQAYINQYRNSVAIAKLVCCVSNKLKHVKPDAMLCSEGENLTLS